MMGTVVGALGQLGMLASEYEQASAERRQQILAETEAQYTRYKSGLAGLPAAIASMDAAADAALVARFPAAPPEVTP